MPIIGFDRVVSGWHAKAYAIQEVGWDAARIPADLDTRPLYTWMVTTLHDIELPRADVSSSVPQYRAVCSDARKGNPSTGAGSVRMAEPSAWVPSNDESQCRGLRHVIYLRSCHLE